MDIEFVGNDERRVAESLNAMFSEAEEVRVAVAYARQSGFDQLPAIEQMTQRARSCRFLAGIDFQLTDLGVLDRLHAPPRSEGRVFWLPSDGAGEARNFHPKVYVAQRGDRISALVGSSNFTAGGLAKNVEANILLRGTSADPAIRQVLEFHEDIWKSPYSTPLSPSVRAVYERLQSRRRDAEVNLRREPRYDTTRHQLELAVAEAIASYGEPRGSKHWLMVTNSDNYILCQQSRLWGDEQRNRIEKITPGDVLLFYIAGLHQLGGMALVTGPVFEDRTPHWGDRVYPFRMPFMPLADPRTGIPLKPLVPVLDLFHGVAPDHWGQVLQRSQIQLTFRDAKMLRDLVLQSAGLGETG